MSIFKKKQQQGLTHSVDNSRSPAYLTLRTGGEQGIESFRAADFCDYKKLTDDEMIPVLKNHLQKMFAGDVDEGNNDMLNNIIFSTAFEAFSDLDKQLPDRIDVTRRIIMCIQADRNDSARIRDERLPELDKLQHKLDKLNRKIEESEEN